MGNTIKRDSRLIVAMANCNSSAFGGGEMVVARKLLEGVWVACDSNGKPWRILISHLRNENYFKIIEQKSMNDLVFGLMEYDTDMQTVYYDMLVDAINTAFKECGYVTVEGIYEYITTNLI